MGQATSNDHQTKSNEMKGEDDLLEVEPHTVVRNRTAYQLFMLFTIKQENEDFVDIDDTTSK